MDLTSVSILISAFLSIASVALGAKYQMGKNKAKQFSQLLSAILAAAEDNSVTEAEFQGIVTAAKALMDKSAV